MNEWMDKPKFKWPCCKAGVQSINWTFILNYFNLPYISYHLETPMAGLIKFGVAEHT